MAHVFVFTCVSGCKSVINRPYCCRNPEYDTWNCYDGNMELTDHLYLQELGYWEDFTEKRIISNSNQSELYFEEPDIEKFVARLELLYPETEYVNRLMTHSWGQKVVRFYDPDGNLIEVGTPV